MGLPDVLTEQQISRLLLIFFDIGWLRPSSNLNRTLLTSALEFEAG